MGKKLTTWYGAEFVVKRNSCEETTLAMVYAEVNSKKLLDENHFLDALQKAITNWVRTTDDGKDAWLESCKDFNVGDLSQQRIFEGSSLWDKLLEVGIRNLRIETLCHTSLCQSWTYDTVLADLEDDK